MKPELVWYGLPTSFQHMPDLCMARVQSPDVSMWMWYPCQARIWIIRAWCWGVGWVSDGDLVCAYMVAYEEVFAFCDYAVENALDVVDEEFAAY